MTSFRTAIAIAVGTLFAGTALAQSNYEIEQRDRQQQARIYQGIQSGELTRHETRDLMQERARIESMERRARADGVLTQHERARIHGAQDHLGRHIYQETHDSQARNHGSHGRDNVRHGWDRGNGHGWGRGNDRGNHYGWGRGNEHGNHNGWGRGNAHGNSNGHQQSGRPDGTHAQRNESHGQRIGSHGQRNESHSHGVTPRTGGEAHAGRTDRSAGRSMPQAQPRSTPSQGTRTFAAARQGGDGGRRTR